MGFTTYHISLTFTEDVLGTVPKREDTYGDWVKAIKANLDENEQQNARFQNFSIQVQDDYIFFPVH